MVIMNNKDIDDMIVRNLNLVPYVINKLGLQNRYDDYIDIGWIGLIKGCENFDSNKDIKESTFLFRSIQLYIYNQLKHDYLFFKDDNISLDYEVDGEPFYNIIPSDYDIDSELKMLIIKKEIENVLKYDMYNIQNRLDHSEIARYIFGIGVKQLRTNDLAKKYNVSRETIKNIKNKFRKKLKKRLKLVLD